MRAVDIPLAIQWHDGMLLSPQHFQEADRRTERLLAYHAGHSAQYHWGVVHLELDVGRLVGGIFGVVEVDAIMPDGTVVSHQNGAIDLSLDLRPYMAMVRDAPTTIYLAIPRFQAATASASDLARHRSAQGVPIVDEHTGEDPLEIPRIAPSMRLIAAHEPPPRFVCLPLARVRLEGEAFVRTDYVPPQIGVTLTSPLGELCQRLAGRLREKAMRLAEKSNLMSRTTDRELIAEIRNQVRALVSALPPFEAFLYSEQPHPFSLYVTLSGMLGQLSALARMPVPPLLAPYRHDDVLETFRAMQKTVFQIVDEGIIESFTAYPFNVHDKGYAVEFKPEFRSRALVIAIRVKPGVREDQLAEWMQKALIGASGRLRTMQESRVLGAGRKKVERHGDLVATKGTLLFELEEQSAYLSPNEPIVVLNASDPAGTTAPSEVILYVKTG
jgi:type VI secretion system protein ImpJ